MSDTQVMPLGFATPRPSADTGTKPASPLTAAWLPATALAVGSFLAGWAISITGTSPVSSDAGGTITAPASAAPAWIRTELFFGMTRPDGSRVSEADWRAFLDAEVIPRFPEGMTVVHGDGRYRGDAGRIYNEPAGIVLLLRPRTNSAADDRHIADITAAYVKQFNQESVLRCDSPVDAKFIAAPQ